MEWDALAGAVSDALETFGVDESVINEMFSDNIEAADAAIEAGCETALANMPDDGEPMDEFIHDFVYGYDEVDDGDDDAAEFDSVSKRYRAVIKSSGRLGKIAHVAKGSKHEKARLGATSVRRTGRKGAKVSYRGVLAIRHGVRTVVNKRIGGAKVHLSAMQKGALKKARMKAHTANAVKIRVKSWKKGRKLGIYQKHGG